MAKASHFRERNLRRRRAFIDQRGRFILVCEGRNSEPLCFHALGRRLKASVIVPVRAAGTPEVIADKAIELSRTIEGRLRDQVWAIFDRDEHVHFDKAIAKCQQHNINVARSNPCFEVWLILHIEDYQRPDGRQSAFERFCKLRPDYKEGKGKNCDYASLLEAVEVAEARAENQLDARKAEGNPFGPPSTTIHHLTTILRERG